jgi:hypothetical protein
LGVVAELAEADAFRKSYRRVRAFNRYTRGVTVACQSAEETAWTIVERVGSEVDIAKTASTSLRQAPLT